MSFWIVLIITQCSWWIHWRWIFCLIIRFQVGKWLAVRIGRGIIWFSLNTQALFLFWTRISEMMISRWFLLLFHYFRRRSTILTVDIEHIRVKVRNGVVYFLKLSNRFDSYMLGFLAYWKHLRHASFHKGRRLFSVGMSCSQCAQLTDTWASIHLLLFSQLCFDVNSEYINRIEKLMHSKFFWTCIICNKGLVDSWFIVGGLTSTLTHRILWYGQILERSKRILPQKIIGIVLLLFYSFNLCLRICWHFGVTGKILSLFKQTEST